MNNPLIAQSNTPHGSIPFNLIKEEDFLPALKEAISIRDQIIEKIKLESNPDFTNTVEALDCCSRHINLVSGTFFNLHSANTNDKLNALATEFSALLSQALNDVSLDEKLFNKLESVYKKAKSLNLTSEQNRLLEKFYKDFIRNGAQLNDAQKKELRSIDKQLSEISVKFSENILKETNSYFLHITESKDCAGLPSGVLESAAELAKEKNLTGWVFTLQAPSLIPFLKYAENAELRKKLYLASAKKAHNQNEFCNDELVKKTAHLRHKRALLLGYKNHASYTLEERMAQNEAGVLSLLQNIYDKSKAAAKRDLDEVKLLKKEATNESDFHQWDYSFYAEKLRVKKFSLSDEILKPYFKLENVIRGAFSVAEKLYGLEFKRNSNIPAYHKDVDVYEVFNMETKEFIGLFYTDFFARDSKRSGAWMTEYKGQYFQDGKNHRPHISIVCNFTRPTQTTPSLLTLNDVLTLFHEFGHSLHGLLSQCQYQSLSGTNVYWDFVELPSQILENWVYEKECLDLFAKHYQTNEPIPQELITKIKAASNFHEGIATVRQISFAILDMKWHTQDISDSLNIEEFEKNTLSQYLLYPYIPGTAMSPSFSHIFSGGYSAGYYSYKWAEVLDADAFEHFKENGIFNSEIAQKFRENILSRGDTAHPMELYKKFRGKEPSPDALLKRAGLI